MDAKDFSDTTLFRLDETHTYEVQKLITEHYIPNWPFLKAAYFDPVKVREAFYQAIADDIKNNASLGIRSKSNGELIACVISSIHTNQTFRDYEQDLILPKYSRFKSWCLKDICARLNTDRYLYIGKMTVHQNYLRRGIGRQLIIACEEVARQLGCNNIVAFSVNAFASEKLRLIGYEILRQIRLVDYVDYATGSKPFTIENPPNTHAVVCHKLV